MKSSHVNSKYLNLFEIFQNVALNGGVQDFIPSEAIRGPFETQDSLKWNKNFEHPPVEGTI